jgi:hypothetical protein
MMLIIGLLVGVALMSLTEYWLHRWHMHKPGFINTFSPRTFEQHHYEHHGKYYRQFNYEPDDYGRGLGLVISYRYFCYFVLTPLLLLGAYYSWWFSVGIGLAILIQHIVWNNFHVEMHDPKGRFFAKWGWYKFVCRYHYLHHRHVNKNYNVVYPFCDVLFGTHAVATTIEIGEMMDLGYLP